MKIRIVLAALIIFGTNLMAQTNSYYDWVDHSAIYVERNQLDSAAYALQQALKMEPGNENNNLLLLNLGVMQRQMRWMDDAYISFTAALRNNDNPALVLHSRASLLCDMGKFDEAMEDYNEIIRTDNQDVEAFYRRGLLFLERNQRAEAETDFLRAEQIDPNDLFTKLSRALRYKLEDRWEDAEAVYTDIINNETPVIPAYYLSRAECYVNTNRFGKAAADLREVEREQRNNPYFYILRGRLRLDQYDKFAAKQDFERAKELGYDRELADEWIAKTK